jgi:hypothetical protein
VNIVRTTRARLAEPPDPGEEPAPLLRALLDNTPDLVPHVDLAATIRVINRLPRGSRREAVIVVDWLSLVAPEQSASVRAAFARALPFEAAARCALVDGLVR